MREILRTNDAVLLNYARALLKDAEIAAETFDQHVSMVEGSIGAFPCRLMVADADFRAAAQTLADAGLSAHVADND